MENRILQGLQCELKGQSRLLGLGVTLFDRQELGWMSCLKMVYSNSISIVLILRYCHFYSVYMTACDVKESFSFCMRVKIVGLVHI